MPQAALGVRRSRLKLSNSGTLNNCNRPPSSTRVPMNNHPASPMPRTPITGPSANSAQAANMIAPAASAAVHSRVNAGFRSARFHDSIGPTAMAAIIGTINGIKTALKNGGPTEILPPPMASNNSG